MSVAAAIEALSNELEPRLNACRTPCLVCDLRVVRQNCETASQHALAQRLTIRPHVKAHKCSQLLREQLSFPNTCGATCATVEEAHGLASAGFDDLLVANEIVTVSGRDTLSATAAMTSRIAVAADSVAGVRCAASAAAVAGREIGVMIDLDVGGGRCGVLVDRDDYVGLAREIARHRSLRLDGIMGYTGRANYLAERDARSAVCAVVRAQLGRASAELARHGFQVTTISGGSTGTYDLDQGLSEMQLGSYALMEGRYCTTDVPFRPALFCVATVISRPRPGVAVLDCGWKAVSGEFGLPNTPPGVAAVRLSDEHLVCDVDLAHPQEVGQRMLLVPAHLDPTMNLHERMLVWDGEELDEWRIDLRRVGFPLTGDVLRQQSQTGRQRRL